MRDGLLKNFGLIALATSFVCTNLEAGRLLHLRIVVVRTEEQARQLEAELKAGTSFPEVAGKYSVDPSSSRGGYLGEVELSKLNEDFRRVAEGLADQEYSPFFFSRGDWVSLYRMPGGPLLDAVELQKKGDQLKSEGKLTEAIRFYEQAVELDPDFIHGWFSLGIAQGEAGNSEKEIESYRSAIRIEPRFDIGFYNLGLALLGKGELVAAKSALQKAVDLRPDLTEAWVNLAAVSLRLDDVASGIEAGRRAVNSNPLSASAHYNLGLALTTSDLEGALRSFDLAASIDPARRDARLNAAVALAKLGRVSEARTRVKGMLAEDPSFEPALQLLRQLDQQGQNASRVPPQVRELVAGIREAGEAGRFEMMSELAEQGVKSHPNSKELQQLHGEALVSHGKSLQAKGQWDRAVTQWRQAVQLYPESLEAVVLLLEALTIRGDFGEAEVLLAKARAWHREAPELNLAESRLAYEKRELARSLDALRELQIKELRNDLQLKTVDHLFRLGFEDQALALVDPEALPPKDRFELAQVFLAHGQFQRADALLAQMPSPAARILRGRVFLAQLQFEEAEKMFRSLLGEDPMSWPAYFFLGQGYLQAGDAETAIEVWQKALTLQADNVDLYYKLGQAGIQAGATEQAVEWLNQGLRLEPGAYLLNFELGRAYLALGRPGEALEPLLRVLQREPDHIRAHYLLGQTYHQLGDEGKAVRHINRFGELKRSLEASREDLKQKKQRLKEKPGMFA